MQLPVDLQTAHRHLGSVSAVAVQPDVVVTVVAVVVATMGRVQWPGVSLLLSMTVNDTQLLSGKD